MESEIKFEASMYIQKMQVAHETRDIIHIIVNGFRLTGHGIYAEERNQRNSKDQLEFAQSIVNKLNS